MPKQFKNYLYAVKNDLDSIYLNDIYTKEKKEELDELIRITDRLVEVTNIPDKYIKIYRLQKERYKHLTDPDSNINDEIESCRSYIEAIDRQNKMYSLSNSVKDIVEMTDYIHHLVDMQNEPIDNLSARMDQNVGITESINRNIENALRRSSKKMKLMRVLVALFVATILCFVIKFIYS